MNQALANRRVFTPRTCPMGIGKDGGVFFWSSWVFITSSSWFKLGLHHSSFTQKDKYESGRELLEPIKDMKNPMNEHKSIKKVNVNLSGGHINAMYYLNGPVCP